MPISALVMSGFQGEALVVCMCGLGVGYDGRGDSGVIGGGRGKRKGGRGGDEYRGFQLAISSAESGS